NQNAGLSGPMRRARLALCGRHRLPIGFCFLKHPKTGLREMARHSHLRFVVATACSDPLVKPADMIVATTLAIKDRAVSRLHKGPLQINIDIAAHRSVIEFAAAGVLARYQAAVARQLLGTAEALDTSDLGPNHHRQDLADSRQSLKPGCLGTRSKNLDHFCFYRFEILAHVIQLIQYALKGLLGMRRKLTRKLHHDLTAALAKGITHALHDVPVFSQRGMHAVLKVRCSLSTIRVRGSSRASRTEEDGIQTVGRVPVLCSRFIPRASSLSLLLTMPIITLANRALTSCGIPPPASISSTTQYQFPTVSTATGDPSLHR